jgi:hypothetical protein
MRTRLAVLAIFLVVAVIAVGFATGFLNWPIWTNAS